MAEPDYKKELERAYRCIRGFYAAHVRGERMEGAALGYHSLTIGAAIRFVHDGALDGAEYFDGKRAKVLDEVLQSARRFLV